MERHNEAAFPLPGDAGFSQVYQGLGELGGYPAMPHSTGIGAECALVYPWDERVRTVAAGETIRYNTVVTSSPSDIAYNQHRGNIIFRTPGKFMVACTYVLSSANAGHCRLHITVNGASVITHTLLRQDHDVMYSFTDIADIPAAGSRLNVTVMDTELHFCNTIEKVASISIYGII